MYRVAVGGLSDVAALKQAIDAGDDGVMGQLLGFPSCCIAFFRRVSVNDGCVDTTWAMAANGGSPGDNGRLIEVELEHAVPGEHPWRWMVYAPCPICPARFPALTPSISPGC